MIYSFSNPPVYIFIIFFIILCHTQPIQKEMAFCASLPIYQCYCGDSVKCDPKSWACVGLVTCLPMNHKSSLQGLILVMPCYSALMLFCFNIEESAKKLDTLLMFMLSSYWLDKISSKKETASLYVSPDTIKEPFSFLYTSI